MDYQFVVVKWVGVAENACATERKDHAPPTHGP